MWANFWLNPTPLWFWLDAKRERLLAAGGIGPLESETLLTEISGFCRRVGMAESTFGRLAVNDGKLVSRLGFGGRVRDKTVERVRAFIDREKQGGAVSASSGTLTRNRVPSQAMPIPAA